MFSGSIPELLQPAFLPSEEQKSLETALEP